MGLAQFAPQIIRWISGSDKAEEAATRVVEIANAVAGTDGSGMAAAQAMRNDPTLAVKFREALVNAEAELDKAYLVDRQNARTRDVALAQLGHTNTRANVMVLMAALGTAGGFVAMAVLGYLKSQYPESMSEGVFGALLSQISTITAYFGLCLRDAFQFEFGSSRGSMMKTELMARTAEKQ